MPKSRNPARDEAFKLFVKSKGKVTSKEIGVKLGVDPALVRRWKKADGWDEKLRARGGAPVGNKNAKGAGAPKRNRNAETHGAYSKVYLDELSPEQREIVEQFGAMNTHDRLIEELKLLLAKQFDLDEKIKRYEALNNGDDTEAAAMVWDRRVHSETSMGESSSVIEVSAFHRKIALLDQQQKLHAKIIKVIDMLKSSDVEEKRLDLDERRHSLAKQKAVGVFDIEDDETTGGV